MRSEKIGRLQAAATVGANQKKSLALVLGGGAPNATLMAGTLVAFIEEGVEFDIISTSGAGAVVGLLYTVPKCGDPKRALTELVDMSISDAIYKIFPVNYKVFHKPGIFADGWRRFLKGHPIYKLMQMGARRSALHRLAADWISLYFAALSPTSLTVNSLGLCAHVPFIEDIVNFSDIKHIKQHLYISA